MAKVHHVDGQVEAALARAFRNVEKYLLDQLQELSLENGIVTADAQNIASMENLWNTLLAEMQRLGYSDAMRLQAQGIREIWEEVNEEAKKYDREGRLYTDPEFSRKSQTALRLQLQGSDMELTQVAGRASQEVATILRQSTLGGTDYRELISSIRKKLDVYEHQARTLAVTALHSFNSMITVNHAEAAGVEWYAYLGPDDQVTREWCDHWVGRRGTLEGFETTSQKWGRDKHPPGIKTWRGGWNCRHRLVPLPGDEWKRYPKGPA